MKVLVLAYIAMLAIYAMIAVIASAIYAAAGNDFKAGMLKFVPGFIGLLINYTCCATILYALNLI